MTKKPLQVMKHFFFRSFWHPFPISVLIALTLWETFQNWDFCWVQTVYSWLPSCPQSRWKAGRSNAFSVLLLALCFPPVVITCPQRSGGTTDAGHVMCHLGEPRSLSTAFSLQTTSPPYCWCSQLGVALFRVFLFMSDAIAAMKFFVLYFGFIYYQK